VSVHYALTIQRWHQNWQKNSRAVVKAYGQRWYRLWHLFLAWSWRIGMQGNAACFQVVAHKNLDEFNRRVFIGSHSLGGVRAHDRDKDRPQPNGSNGAHVDGNGNVHTDANGTNGAAHAE
jgi:hypothetical protein